MAATRTTLDERLLQLSTKEKRRIIRLLARSLLASGKIVWPDNTRILDDDGNELGVVLIVETPKDVVPSRTSETKAEPQGENHSSHETTPIEEFFMVLKRPMSGGQSGSK